jgi:hypothetical protein
MEGVKERRSTNKKFCVLTYVVSYFNVCFIHVHFGAGCMTQAVECLLRKCKVLSSNPSTTTKKCLLIIHIYFKYFYISLLYFKYQKRRVLWLISDIYHGCKNGVFVSIPWFMSLHWTAKDLSFSSVTCTVFSSSDTCHLHANVSPLSRSGLDLAISN